MDYEIKMPVLSDTMQSGKLIKWHVKENQNVKKGDVIADVESDKAIMEVQTFKDGVVKKLLTKEGEEIKVGKTIAVIDTKGKVKEQNIPKQEPKKESDEIKKPIIKKSIKKPEEILNKQPVKVLGEASAAAKNLAQKLNVDIQTLQKENKLPKPAHLKDVQEAVLTRYFTPKAIKLLDEYSLDADNFKLDHKIDSDEVYEYITKFSIAKREKISANRKNIIKTVTKSAKKAVFHIYETLDLSKFEDKEYKLTSILIKIIADSMQNHPQTRAVLKDEYFHIYPNSSISVAVTKDDGLYMAVIKDANLLSLEEIDKWVREIKQKNYTFSDMSGSTFGISNLGMYGIKSFDAMIYKDDCGIAAFGAMQENKISTVFSFDHTVINGQEAALFVNEIKQRCKNG